VSRKWICEVVSAGETSTQVQLALTHALQREGLWERVEAAWTGWRDRPRPGAAGAVGGQRNNGPQMASGPAREFMVLCAIAQHFGRPHTPVGQAWIETLSGHVKTEFAHLLKITDPAVLRAEQTSAISITRFDCTRASAV
jgi:putative transposase